MTMTIDSEDDVSIRSAVAHRHRSIGGIVTFDCSSLMVHCCLAKSGNKVTRAAKQFLCSTKVARRGSALRLARRLCIDYLSVRLTAQEAILLAREHRITTVMNSLFLSWTYRWREAPVERLQLALVRLELKCW